ncbi:replication initiator protein A [bacterium]|nr:replication initiator protein A [bacterium]
MKNQMELMPEEFQESMTEDALPPHESAVLFSPPLPEVGRRVSRGDENRKAPKRFSRDEMNLAEFPLSVLSTRVRPGVKTLEFEDTVYDKNGKPIQREWIITAADKFGLPTASDDEVLLGLLKISVEKGLDERKVFFTCY